MTDDPHELPGDTTADDESNPPDIPPEEMSRGFYAGLALIGILLLMILAFNYPAARANAGMEMTRVNWTLESLVDNTGILIPAAQSGTGITAVFDREGHMNGYAGCNRYFATYQTREYSVNISDISSTKMFCQGPGVMQQESAFLADLSKASSFRVSEHALKFYDAAGKPVLTFEAV
jgi:heat shock protein HslJ